MSQRWVCTDFIMDLDFWTDLVSKGIVTYVGYGEETCPTTQRKHWQCWFLTGRRTIGAMIKIMKPRHIEAMRGSFKQNDAYCSKESTMQHIGERPTNMNSTSVAAAKRILDNGGTIENLFDEGFQLAAIRWGEQYLSIKRKRDKFEKPEVIWIYGPTGIGKSKYAREITENAWVSSEDLKWFDGYHGAKHVIFDDFRGDQCKLSWLLRLLDGYELRVPIKGGHTNWLPSKIVITSCLSPTECYSTSQEKLDQLTRRLTHVLHMDGTQKCCVLPQGNTVPGAKRRKLNDV